MKLFAQKASRAFAWASLAAAASAGMAISTAAPAHAFLPAFTNPAPTGGSWPDNPSSFGFFFDTTSNVRIDALGFSYQDTWIATSPSYTVTLWSFKNAGAAPTDFTQIASRTFNPGTIYTLQDDYWWNSLDAPIVLPITSSAVDPGDQKGYVIAAIGDFSGSTNTVKFEGGVATVDPLFDLGGNGFNVSTDTEGFYPIPIYPSDPDIGIDGYFNPNLSYVPGPLPILGTASAFGLTRRMRKRINSAKN
jgi:hypothetical protein